MKKTISRKDFLLGGSMFAASTALAQPVRNLIGAHGMDFIEDAETDDNPYIRKSLIAMWDGEWNAGWNTHDSEAKEWIDLTGNGYDAVLHVGNQVLWDDNSLYNNSSTIRDLVAYNPLYGQIDYTFECVFMRLPTNAYNFQVTMRGQGTYLQVASGLQTGSSYYSSTPTVSPNVVGSVSCTIHVDYNEGKTYWHSYTDGELYKTSTLNTTAQSHRPGTAKEMIYFCSAGDWSPSISCYGHIYSVRCYSRALTDKEIRYNHLIDKMRFNLP